MKQLLIQWNNSFPLDRVYRQKYKIPFGSEEHRRINQIDVYYDWLEDKLFQDYHQELLEDAERKEAYEKDGILNKEAEKEIEEGLEDVFDSLDVTQLNEKQEDG